MLIVLLHIFACIWVCLGRDPKSWATTKTALVDEESDGVLYLAAIYWAMTTFATVGYGDFSGSTTIDYFFTMIVFVKLLRNVIAVWSVHVFLPFG